MIRVFVWRLYRGGKSGYRKFSWEVIVMVAWFSVVFLKIGGGFGIDFRV